MVEKTIITKEKKIGQIKLPFAKAVEIAFLSLRVRFWRAMITTAGIFFAIAFLTSILVSRQISLAMPGSMFHEIEVPAQKIWVIVMSLLVCVVGITNAMLMAVTERYREIGTMKCLGALDWFIVELFLLESMFQGGVGALAGAVISTIITIIAHITRQGFVVILHLPVGNILLLWLFSVSIGMILSVIGAVYPAYRAARMVPADAMRVEL